MSPAFEFRETLLTEMITKIRVFLQLWIVKVFAAVDDVGLSRLDCEAAQRPHDRVLHPFLLSLVDSLGHGTVAAVLRGAQDDHAGVVQVGDVA